MTDGDREAMLRWIATGACEEPDTDRRALLMALDELNADEIAPIAMMARRVLRGRREYGALNLADDQRDFRRERTEEAADLVCYDVWLTRKAARAEMVGGARLVPAQPGERSRR